MPESGEKGTKATQRSGLSAGVPGGRCACPLLSHGNACPHTWHLARLRSSPTAAARSKTNCRA